MNSHGKMIDLLRIRNPWGAGRGVWKGPWGESSKEWDSVAKNIQSSMAARNQGEGEFWISLADYDRNFATTNICCLTPDFYEETTVDLGLGQFHDVQISKL